jgi:alkylhydroperoxidase/carboxymuconolactone decarboxylase family protein YurZ
MTNYEAGFAPGGNQSFKDLFGEDFKPPFPRLPESTEAANPRRIAQRALLASELIDLNMKATLIFTVMITLGFHKEAKLYMQGMRNLGYTDRQIGEMLELIGLYAGVPRAVDGHVLLSELVEEDKERPHSEGFYYKLPRH